ALEVAVFAAAQRPGGFVPIKLSHRIILVAVVQHRAIVAGENYQRVPDKLQAVECLEYFTGAPVELRNSVPAGSHAGLARKTRMGNARHVDVVRGEIEEERVALVALDELNRLPREVLGHVLVLPTRRFAAGHVADTADGVDNRHVVAVARMNL